MDPGTDYCYQQVDGLWLSSGGSPKVLDDVRSSKLLCWLLLASKMSSKRRAAALMRKAGDDACQVGRGDECYKP